MNPLLPTNTDPSAVAVHPDPDNYPYGITSLLDLIQSMRNKQSQSHMDQLTIRLNPAVLKLLKHISRHTHQPMAEIVRICLLHVLKGDHRGSTEDRRESMTESGNA